MPILYYASAVFFFLLMLSSESQSDSSPNATFELPASSQTLMPSKTSGMELDDEADDIYPNPRKYPKQCQLGSEPKWICNSDLVLSLNEALKLEEQLEYLYEADNICPCQEVYCAYDGFPMVLVVLNTFQFSNAESYDDKRQQIQTLARRFLDEWKFDTCNDGAVTVAVANESLAVTVVGETSSSSVSVSCQEAIENATEHIFQEGQFYNGLLKLIEQYRLALHKDHSCNSHEILATEQAVKRRVMIPIILVVAGLIISAIIAGVLLTYRQRQSKDITTEAGQPLRDQRLPSENA